MPHILKHCCHGDALLQERKAMKKVWRYAGWALAFLGIWTIPRLVRRFSSKSNGKASSSLLSLLGTLLHPASGVPLVGLLDLIIVFVRPAGASTNSL